MIRWLKNLLNPFFKVGNKYQGINTIGDMDYHTPFVYLGVEKIAGMNHIRGYDLADGQEILINPLIYKKYRRINLQEADYDQDIPVYEDSFF